MILGCLLLLNSEDIKKLIGKTVMAGTVGQGFTVIVGFLHLFHQENSDDSICGISLLGCQIPQKGFPKV